MHPLVSLAKKAVETYIKKGEKISPNNIDKKFLSKKSGTFVTIKKNNKLRGCIGTYLPTKENLVQEIIDNAIKAATEDSRFEPIKKEELDQLSYEVYILTRPEPVKNLSQLNPKKYGIIVKTSPLASDSVNVIFDGRIPYKTGVLLPGLKKIDNPKKQLFVACQKANIDLSKDKIRVWRFKTKKYVCK